VDVDVLLGVSDAALRAPLSTAVVVMVVPVPDPVIDAEELVLQR